MRVLMLLAMIGLSPVWLEAGQPTLPDPVTRTDYDEGDFYFVRGDREVPYHGMRDAWVYNRAMVWLGPAEGVDGTLICYSKQSPLLLTGTAGVSRWHAGESGEIADADEDWTRFTRRGAEPDWDHTALPPLQFQIEQHPTAEFEVRNSNRPWQLIVVLKGRGGPPLYASPWQHGPGKLSVNLLELYRNQGHPHHFAELNFFVALAGLQPEQEALVEFCLRLVGGPVVVPSLPVIRTQSRADREGVPIQAVVLDEEARRLGAAEVELRAIVPGQAMELTCTPVGIWKGVARSLPVGRHSAILRATRRSDGKLLGQSELHLYVTDGHFVGYDEKLKLLTRKGVPLGPIAGSYRAQHVFRGIGTPRASLLQGEAAWKEAIADPQRADYGFHWWESLTPGELKEDYAYLERCGWRMVHLCSAWLWWPRFDAGGRLSPYYAERLATVCNAARRHGLSIHLALSHYPLGFASPPYAQYLEAGFQPAPRGQRPPDYDRPDSAFHRMFREYVTQFAMVFADETAISSFTAAGEGDSACGATFVNAVHDTVTAQDRNHLVLCEPHHPIRQNPNYYRQSGWEPTLGGMRAYDFDRTEDYRRRRPVAPVGVQYRLSAMGHVFLAEGAFYGFLGGNHQYMRPDQPMDIYRRCVRNLLYTGLALRSPILLTWEERIVEDERVVLEQVRAATDWSKPFETPPLAIRIGSDQVAPADREPLLRYEAALAELPLAAMYLWEDEAAPPEVLHVIDARQSWTAPRLVRDGGQLPDALAARIPLRLPPGWSAQYSRSADQAVLLAYLYETPPGESGEDPRGARPATDLELINFPAGARQYRLFDLASRKLVVQGAFDRSAVLESDPQAKNLFLHVGP